MGGDGGRVCCDADIVDAGSDFAVRSAGVVGVEMGGVGMESEDVDGRLLSCEEWERERGAGRRRDSDRSCWWYDLLVRNGARLSLRGGTHICRGNIE